MRNIVGIVLASFALTSVAGAQAVSRKTSSVTVEPGVNPINVVVTPSVTPTNVVIEGADGTEATVTASGAFTVAVTDGTGNTISITTMTGDYDNLDGVPAVATAAVLYGRIDSGMVRPLRIDASTHSLQVIDYAHHEIHGGSHYYVQGFLQLDDEDTHYIKLVTPNTAKWSHFIFNIQSTGICTSYLDEDATGGMTGGAGVTPINNNRNSAKTSGVTLTSGVTNATGYTTRLENDMWGAAGFKESIGGGSSREDELILKQNTVYLRTFISGADDNIIQFKASWYEHTCKD